MMPLSRKRSYLLLLSPILITLLALLLVACGVGETNAPSETTETTSLIEETTAPDPSPEETDSEETSTEETSAEETSTEETSTEETSTEKTSTEETITEETSTEETSTEETSTEETSTEETSAEETSTEETSTEETSTEETSTEETSTEETSTEETSTEETCTEETSTEEPPSINIPTDGAHVTFFDSTKPRPTTVFNYAHHAEFELVMDSTYGSVLKLTTAGDAYDPYVSFNYAAYMRGLGLDRVNADDCKYVVITLRGENCSCNDFELYYYAGIMEDATPGYQTTATFDATSDGWQRIVFDLSSASWEGDVNGFRLDFLTAPEGAGESVYIYSIDFFKTAAEAYGNEN